MCGGKQLRNVIITFFQVSGQCSEKLWAFIKHSFMPDGK